MTQLSCLKCRRHMTTGYNRNHGCKGQLVLVRIECSHCNEKHILFLCLDGRPCFDLVLTAVAEAA